MRPPARDAAWAEVLARLETGSVRERGAAMLLRYSGVFEADHPRGQRTWSPERGAPHVAALAALAAQSHDPVVLRWALAACDAGGAAIAAETCAAMGPRLLLEQQPDDALAWAQVLQREPTAIDEALAAMASPRARWVTSDWVLPSLVDAAFPESRPGHLRVDLLTGALSVELAHMASLAPVSRVCAPDTVRDDFGRRSRCNDIATGLIERGDSLFTLSIGRGIGERVGWPADRVAALREAQVRLHRIEPVDRALHAAWSCANVERWRAFVRDRAEAGELGALRRRRDAAAAPSQ